MKTLGKMKLFLVFLLISTIYTQTIWAKNDKNFDFNLSINKNEVYVGESLRVTFIFKHKLGLNIAEANFAPPAFSGFWVKPGNGVPNIVKNGDRIYTLHYLITPQKAGFLRIEPARMDIGIVKRNQKNTLRFERVKWKSIFSNAVEIKAKNLPKGVTLFGDYNISATVDSTKVLANQPVNLTLKIQGSGNIDEIEEFSVTNENAAVFSDSPKIKSKFVNAQIKGQMVQKFAFISDKNFTIAPFKIEFFDSKNKQIRTIETKPIKITVQGTNANKNKVLQKLKPENLNQPRSITLLLLISAGSFLLGITATILYIRKEKNSSKKGAIIIQNRIKKAKNSKSLLQILLPYKGKSEKIDTIIKRVEENIYEGKNHKIDKKELAKKFDEYVCIMKNHPRKQ